MNKCGMNNSIRPVCARPEDRKTNFTFMRSLVESFVFSPIYFSANEHCTKRY